MILASCNAPAPRRADAGNAASTGARLGDTVWVLANAVRADRRAQFEEFAEAFYAAGLRSPSALDSLSAASFRQTRLLFPTAPDSDGTYTYLFIMDPRIPGADYDIGKALERLFPAAEAKRLAGLLDSSIARPQKGWLVIQRLPRL
jgi:hypothetical protein